MRVIILVFLLISSFTVAQEEIKREPLTLDFGDFESKAELTYPAQGSGPFPTVILIHGGGPADMNMTSTGVDENGQPFTISANFKDISDFLSQQGFAVLRYNKHYVTGHNEFDAEKYYAKFTPELELADAEIALEAAKANLNVDSQNIFVYGWSNGTIAASALAAKHPDLAGLVLQSPVAVPWRTIVADILSNVQIPYLESFTSEGVVNEETLLQVLSGSGGITAKGIINFIADPTALASGELRINSSFDINNNGVLELNSEVTPEALSQVTDASGLPGLNTIGQTLPNVAEQASNIEIPVLILQGTNDAVVPLNGAETADAAFAEAEHPDHTLKIYEGLGHSLGKAPSLIADDFLPIEQEPLDDLVTWLRERVRN
jgi:uncharacterized protein